MTNNKLCISANQGIGIHAPVTCHVNMCVFRDMKFICYSSFRIIGYYHYVTGQDTSTPGDQPESGVLMFCPLVS